jgi:arylsulfatase A-like enzyme
MSASVLDPSSSPSTQIRSRTGGKPPNVVMLVLDSVRAQNTSVNGYHRRTTPFLEELAANAVVYSNAISTTVSTVPAHASMFTGTNVSTHDLYVDGDKLADQFTTMAEALSAAGYRSLGVCYQDDVSPDTGLHRGFERFEMDDEPGMLRQLIRSTVFRRSAPAAGWASAAGKAHGHPSPAPSPAPPPPAPKSTYKQSNLYRRLVWEGTRFADQGAAATQNKAERFLDSLRPDEPFFMYLHYDEAHLPYRPPAPYRYRFLDKSLRHRPALVNQNRNAFFTGDVPMTDEDFAVLTSLHDGAIAFLDYKVRLIHDMLVRRRILDDTIVIVMGDHGDSIGEHGLMSHKFCVYDTLTRVLLVVKYPRGTVAPTRHEDVVQHTDLLPTVLELTGLTEQAVRQRLEGNSLVSDRIRHRPDGYAVSELLKPFGREARNVRGRMAKYDRQLFAIRSRQHKFIWSSDGRHEFYDVAADPAESVNLLERGTPPPAAETLRRAAEAHRPAFEASLNRNRHRL